jgi:hypothetical protein
MKLRELLGKINDALRPMHAQGEGQSGSDPLLDARVAARAGNAGGIGIGAGPPPASTDWVPSHQDEELHS